MKNIYQAKGETLGAQYYDVGRLFGREIQQSVAKIGRSRAKLTNARREVAERALANIENKPTCRELVECITAWSAGAEISVKQAMWCMADNLSGCQTLMARYQSGVALLHSEEEFRDANHIELHMTDPHTIEFDDVGNKSKTLVYNDLLPGAGLYGWKRDMIVAVDSLFLREDGIEKVESPLLANVVSWLIWRMEAAAAEPEKIVKLVESLGELIDGYAINVVRKVGGDIVGYKLTFARNQYQLEYLGEAQGDYLRQVNIVDPNYPKMNWVLPARNIWRGGYKYFVDRLRTMDEHVKRYGDILQRELKSAEMADVHTRVQQTIFGELREAYINPDVGAICVGLVDQSGTSVSAKLNDGGDVSVLEYIDYVSLNN